MAKWNLTTPANGGDLLPDIEQARVLEVRRDYNRNIVHATVGYGREVEGTFIQSPINPPNGGQILADLEQYADVRAAWENFERALFRRMASENVLPPGAEV